MNMAIRRRNETRINYRGRLGQVKEAARKLPDRFSIRAAKGMQGQDLRCMMRVGKHPSPGAYLAGVSASICGRECQAAIGIGIVHEEILHRRGTTLVRRMRLAPGEASPWHSDPWHRVSVVLSGDALAVEFRDGSPTIHAQLSPGQVDWVEPSDRVHRAVNAGAQIFEEVTIYFLGHPDAAPQVIHA
jgi:quercetin dioxygenase-like cupin family protein